MVQSDAPAQHVSSFSLLLEWGRRSRHHVDLSTTSTRFYSLILADFWRTTKSADLSRYGVDWQIFLKSDWEEPTVFVGICLPAHTLSPPSISPISNLTALLFLLDTVQVEQIAISPPDCALLSQALRPLHPVRVPLVQQRLFKW